jgi:hypothetical protein
MSRETTSNTWEYPTRLSTRLANRRRASRAVSEADEEEVQEETTVDEVATAAVVVEAEAEVGDEVNKLNYEILRRYLAHSELFAIDLRHFAPGY